MNAPCSVGEEPDEEFVRKGYHQPPQTLMLIPDAGPTTGVLPLQRQMLERIHRGLKLGLPQSKAEFALIAVWGVALFAIEIIGRKSVSDITDGFMLVVLGLLAILSAIVHWTWQFKTVAALMALFRRVAAGIAARHVVYGVDLRQTPRIPRRLPVAWLQPLAGCAFIAAALIVQFPNFPSAARGFAASRFYVGSVVLIGLLWGILILGSLIMSIFVWIAIEGLFVERYVGRGKRPLWPELLSVAAALGALAMGALWLPAWMPLVVYWTSFGLVSVALAASSSGLEFVWRERRGGPMGSIDGRCMLWLQWAGLTLVTTILVLLSRGELLVEETATVRGARVTAFLGNLLAWAAVGGFVVIARDIIRLAMLGFVFNPRRIAAVVSAPGDSADAARILRRNEIRNRRRIIRGLQKLMKRAARLTRVRSTGLWIGLQHWFVPGLSTDGVSHAREDRETTAFDGVVGPPYHRVFPPEARYHFLQMAMALEIDLIFVEHGLTFRRLSRVLRVLFETYDMYGGRQRAEERHFVGLPRTRVVIHNYDQTNPGSHGRKSYPEPDYQEIGRARILHVFKDREETEQFEPVPDSREGTPVLTGV